MSAPATNASNLADIAAQEETERRARYQRAWKAYDGEGPPALDVEPGEPDDNIRLDYAELIVDKGVSFLVGKDQGVTFTVEPPEQDETDETDEDDESEAEEQAEEVDEERGLATLDAAWPPHKRQLDLHNLATNGGVCGHAWLRLYEDGRVSVLDPESCSAEWNEDDVEILERYLIEWLTVDEDTGLGVARRKRIEPDNAEHPTSWTIFDEEHDEDGSNWVITDETNWPHDFAPVIDSQNLPAPNTFYGKSDLETAILDQIEQLESVASDMKRIARLHGHPVPVVIGEDASRLEQIDVAIGKLLAIPNGDAKLDQLAIAELTSLLELFRELKTSLFESARIPKVALGETTNAGPTTGVALKVEYEPLVEKTQTKRITYGYLLVEVARRVLALKGLANWSVALNWPEILPSDPVSDANAAEAELRMGIVSKHTIAEKFGYDWETEEQRISEETPNFDPGTWTYTGGLPGAPATSPPAAPSVPPSVPA